MPRFVVFFLFGLFCCQSPAEKPNIVLILADDLGIGDVRCYGGERCLIKTPNIDALAAGGLRFTDAHVNASVCHPTRLALMTGRYPWRFGGRSRGNGPWGFVGPRDGAERYTLAKMLRRGGYHTGYVGKWHLGTIMTTRDDKPQGPANVDFNRPLRLGPVEFGFHDSFILSGSLDMFPYAFARNNVWQGEVTAQKGWSAFNRVGPAEKEFEDHEVLETFYTEAESFLSRQTSKQPFFLFLALTAPHTPTSPGVAWRGKSKLGVYGDFVMEVDHAVERVTGALRQRGLEKNTLVLFSSDHGPANYAGNILKATVGQMHQLEDQGHFPAGPYRGYKFCVYEGGLRVPLIAHWPDQIGSGRVSEALVGLNDLFATIAELASVPLGESEAPDSMSFANLLLDPDASASRTSLVMQSSTECFVLRDGSWKLCLCPGSGAGDQWQIEPTSGKSWAGALSHFKGTLTQSDLAKSPFVQLFDLDTDVHEDRNVAAEHPQQVARMVKMLREVIANGRSTPGRSLKNDRDIVLHPRLPPSARKRLAVQP